MVGKRTLREKEAPVKKKKKKKARKQEDEGKEEEENDGLEEEKESEEKMNASEEEMEEDGKRVLKPTERNLQMWKDCQVSIENAGNHHDQYILPVEL